MAETTVEVDVREAIQALENANDALEGGAREAIDQLMVAAEGPMKAEAPAGSGRGAHMRDSIETQWYEDLAARTVPTKQASDGNPLVGYVVGEPLPSYSPSNPPPAGPLIEWADAKLGDPSAGYAIQYTIAHSGHSSFPDPFVDRAISQWESQVDTVASRAISKAIQGAMR